MSVLRKGVRWLGLGAACSLSWATTAAAADASDKAAAEALFQQGKALMDQKHYGEACEKFRASQDLDAGLGTLLHLADCYEKEGRTASAWATFEEAASVAASRGDTNRHDIARGRAASLKPHLSFIVIRAAEQPPAGAVVTRDGRTVPSAVWGVPIPVDPGTIVVELSAPGYQSTKLEVRVAARAAAPVEVTLPALVLAASSEAPTGATSSPDVQPASDAPTEVVAPPPAPELDEPNSSQKTVGLVLGGVGVVALGVAAVFTVSGYSDYQDSLDDCDPSNENACGVKGKSLRDDARASLDVATIVGSAGAAVLGTGVVLYVTAPASPSATGAEALLTRGLGVGYQGVW